MLDQGKKKATYVVRILKNILILCSINKPKNPKEIMRFKITALILVLAFGLGSFNTAQAQAHEQGQIGITAGIGYSLIGGLFDAVTDGDNVEGTGTPVINGMVDYGIGDKFSLGLAVSYQSFKAEYSDYLHFDFTQESFEEKWSCLSIGVRPLLHFGNSDNFGMYTGARVGFTTWSYSNSSNNITFIETDVSLGTIGVQPLFGANIYFTDNIGMNMEIGIGTYLAAAGIKVRL
jgi:hypothetical protein